MVGELGTLASLTGVLLAGVISPGPNFVLVTSTAVRASRRSGLATAGGLALASMTWAALAEAGFALLVPPGSPAAAAVRLLGGAYLLYLGARMVFGARRPPPPAGGAGGLAPWPALRRGYLASLTNPKSLAFYVGVFAAMVPAHAAPWLRAAVPVAAFAVSAGWYGLLAVAFSGTRVRAGFARVKAGAEAAMGLCLVGLGGRLLLAR